IVIVITVIAASLVISALVRSAIASAEVFAVFTHVTYKFFPAIIHAVFDERAVIEFQFPLGHRAQFGLNVVVMNEFLMPVAVSQLHVISNRIGKSLALFTIRFVQGLINYD